MAEIKDFGKKIGGARKDLWKTYGLSLDDIQNLNEAEQKTYIKRDYIWPTPDAKKLVEEGKTPWIVFWQREIRKTIRKEAIVFSNYEPEDVLKSYLIFVQTIRDKVMAIDSMEKINKFYESMRKDYFGYGSAKFRMYADSRKMLITQYRLSRYQYYVTKTGFPYNTKKTANAGKPRKKNFTPEQLEFVRYTGKKYRGVSNVTPEEWQKKFSFAGVEFGNWTSQQDRQYSMNYCYDSLCDMAEAIGISLKDIAFSGELSLAFGARGRSNACAHYEPLRKVINLSKMHGAGSLAHEWMHALDREIACFYGITDEMLGSETNHKNKLPEEFNALITQMIRSLDDPYKNSDYYEGSVAFGACYSKDAFGYWTSTCEMLARAFACYVMDRIGVCDDYLVAHAEAYIVISNGELQYAFPCGDERKALNQRFDALFKRLKKDGLLHEPEKDEFLEPVVFDKIMISTPPAEISYEEEANGQLCLFG